MGSRSTQPAAAATMMTLAPVMTLKGHKSFFGSKRSMAYSPDGKRIISVCSDQTIRQWDLQAGREIEQVRHLHEGKPYRAETSRDGRWVMTFGRDGEYTKVKAYEVETGIVKTVTFQDSRLIDINSFDISADGKVLACVSLFIVRIWGMDTGKLVAQLGPFKSREGLQHPLTFGDPCYVGGVRFSPDSKKVAVESNARACLEVWDVQTRKVDAQVGKKGSNYSNNAPIFWTKKGTILAAFNFAFNDYSYNLEATTIYEFNASTLETVGDPFEGERSIRDFALSFDGTLLTSSFFNDTIKLWAFEPRQLLASFHVQHEMGISKGLTFSPDTRQLVSWVYDKIFMYNIPPDILASIRVVAPDAQEIVCICCIYLIVDVLMSSSRSVHLTIQPSTSYPMCSPHCSIHLHY